MMGFYDETHGERVCKGNKNWERILCISSGKFKFFFIFIPNMRKNIINGWLNDKFKSTPVKFYYEIKLLPFWNEKIKKNCVELNLKLFSCHAGFNLFNYLEFFHYKKGGNECVKERNILNSNLIFLMSIKQPFLSHNPLSIFFSCS